MQQTGWIGNATAKLTALVGSAGMVLCAVGRALADEDIPLIAWGEQAGHYHVHGAVFWGLVTLATVVITVVITTWVVRREARSRRVVEQALEMHRRRLDVIVRNADAGIVVLQGGEIIFTNGRFCEMVGQSHDNVLGRRLQEFAPGDELGDVREAQVDDHGDGYDSRLRHSGGSELRVHVRQSVVDWEGGPASLLFLWDVTRRRKEEELLRLSRFSIENVGLIILWVKRDGSIRYANHAGRELFGYSAGEFKALNLEDLRLGTPDETWDDFWLEQQEKGTATFEFLGRTKFGAVIPLEISAFHLCFGEEEYLFAFGRDVTNRKRTEATLRESEERFRRLFMDVPIGVMVVDLNGRILSANDAFCKSVGYQQVDLVAMSHLDITHPEDIPNCEERLRHLLDTGDNLEHMDKRYLRRDGEITWCRQTVRVLRDEGRQPLYFIMLEEDITDKRRAELRMRMLQRAMDQSPVSVVVLNPAGRLEYANRRYREEVEAEADELYGSMPAFLQAEEMQQALRTAMERGKTTGKPWYGEITGVAGDGRRVVQNVSMSVAVDEEGEAQHFIAVIEDVTERVESEERRAELERRFRRAVEESPYPTMIIDEDGSVVLLNSAWMEGTGYDLEDMPTTEAWCEVMSEGGRERFTLGFERLFAQKNKVDLGEWDIITRTGEERTWAFLGAPLGMSEHGRSLGIVTAVDLTRRKLAEQKLRKSEALFREYFEIGLVGMAITYPDKSWGVFNDKLCDILGYPREELQELSWTELTHPDDVDADVANFERLLTGEADRYVMDKRFIRKDGEVVHATISVACSRNENGEADHFVAHVEDISWRVKAQEELRTRTRIEALVSAVSSSFIAVGPGNFERVVHSALAQLGRFLGCDIISLFEGGDGVATVTQQWRSPGAQGTTPEETVVVLDDTLWWHDAVASRRRVNLAGERPGGRGQGVVLAVPLAWMGHTLGALCLERGEQAGEWNEHELMLSETVGNILAQAIEGKRAEDEIAWSLQVKEALERLYPPLVRPNATLPDICTAVLDEARLLTGSVHGYVAVIDKDTGDLLAFTLTEMLSGECQVEIDDPLRFPMREDGTYPGLWGHSLNTLEPFVCNDSVASHPASVGVPQGHVPLERVLSVPVMLGSELVGQIALSNKETQYTDDDLDAVVQLANYYSLAIQRVRSIRAIEASEERYRSLVESMNEGLLVEGADLRISYVNHQFCNMLQRSRGDVQGRKTEEFLLPEDVALYREQTERRSQGSSEAYELRWKTSKGTALRTLVSPTPLFTEDGRSEGGFAVITDITRMRMLEAQLQQAQKLESIGQLAAGIAHEINTPSQYVENNTRYLETAFEDMDRILDLYAGYREKREAGQDVAAVLAELDRAMNECDLNALREDIPDAIDDALDGLERITAIVKSVKQFAHPGQESKEPIDLNAIVRDAVTVSTNEWKYHSRMETSLDEGLPAVPGVKSQINQVLLNLVVNAAAANRDKVESGDMEQGVITISTRREGDMAVVCVADNGTGIPESIRDSVFNPFFTTKEPGKGTGQGLAIAHTIIVEKHSGQITFDSVTGEGTTFRVELPFAVPQEDDDV